MYLSAVREILMCQYLVSRNQSQKWKNEDDVLLMQESVEEKVFLYRNKDVVSTLYGWYDFMIEFSRLETL